MKIGKLLCVVLLFGTGVGAASSDDGKICGAWNPTTKPGESIRVCCNDAGQCWNEYQNLLPQAD